MLNDANCKIILNNQLFVNISMSNLYHTPPDYDTKAKLHLGVSGRIVKWDDERGFGFVQTDAISDEIFFHANTLVARERTPKLNEAITVHAQYDADKKRWSATKITSPKREQILAQQQAEERKVVRPLKAQLQWAVPVALLWLAVVAWKMLWLAGAYALVSLIALALYAWDKRCAITDNSRVPEANLHAVAVLGGWAGALVARYLFRHKTSKQPFVAIFWGTVVVNVVGTVYLIVSGVLPI